MNVAAHDRVRATSDPNCAAIVDPNENRCVVRHFTSLADAITARERAVRFALRDESGDQTIRSTRCGIFDDADAGGKCANGDIVIAARTARENAQSEAVAGFRKFQDRAVIGRPRTQCRFARELGDPPTAAALDIRGFQRAEFAIVQYGVEQWRGCGISIEIALPM